MAGGQRWGSSRSVLWRRRSGDPGARRTRRAPGGAVGRRIATRGSRPFAIAEETRAEDRRRASASTRHSPRAMRATREVVRVDRSGEGGEEDVPRVGRDVTGQECMTGCRRGMPLCGKSSLLTLNRRRVGQLFRGNSRTTGCRSSPPPNFSKVPRSRARCGFRNFRFDSYAISVRIDPNVC